MTNEIAVTAPKLPANLPRPGNFERLTEAVQELQQRFWTAFQSDNKTGKAHAYHEIAVIDEFMPEIGRACAQFENLKAPATKTDLADHFGLLVKSFPNAGKDDASVYGRMLLEDVGAHRPSLGAVEAACRHLRRTNRFLPTIAEALTALADAEKEIGELDSFLNKQLPYRRHLAIKDIAQRKEWDAEQERMDARRAESTE